MSRMLPKEQILATHLMLAMGEWSPEARENMVEWVQAALKEQRCDGIKTGLEMANKYLALAGNIEDAQSMIKVAIATVEDT